jgi:hypothetical protein
MARKETVQPRTETTYVRQYLQALRSSKAPRGRRTPEWLQAQVESIPVILEETEDPLERVQLQQRLIDCEHDLAEATASDDLTITEERFVKVAAAWSERKGVTYAAWRAEGVPAAVLKQAGVR